MKSTQIPQDQLDKIKNLEITLSQLTQQLGIATFDKVTAEAKITSITQQLNSAVEEKNKTFDELSKEYGDGTINLDEGTFIPANS